MTFLTRKPRRYKSTHDFERELDSRNARADTQYVAIVVFARLAPGIGIAAKRRAYAAQFVCRHRSTDTAAANQNADLDSARLHGFAYLFCVIRIVVGNGAVVSAEIDDLIAGLTQLINYPLVERVPGMICSNSNSHLTKANARASARSQR